MADQVINCPRCKTEIPLTEALTLKVQETQREIEKENVRRLAEDRKRQEEEFAERLKSELERKGKDAARQAEEKFTLELRDAKAALADKDKKLDESRRAELELRQRQRELEDKAKSLELEVAKRLDQERKRIEEETFQRASEQARQKMLEMEKREADLRKTIDDLKRKSEQGSQQTQGEVVELELESILRNQFPYDRIEPVAKGIRGADVIQTVHSTSGQVCGTIIWESKQTKLWSDGWIDKLKEDQRAVKAEIAVLLTAALPKGVTLFGQQNGVWVTGQACAVSLAAALRMALIQVALAKSAAVGKQGKMELLYNYLLGTEFRQRVEAIVDAAAAMREQLEREKRAYTKLWSEREKHIERVQASMSGIHGDLTGLGASLPQIRALELDPEGNVDRLSIEPRISLPEKKSVNRIADEETAEELF